MRMSSYHMKHFNLYHQMTSKWLLPDPEFLHDRHSFNRFFSLGCFLYESCSKITQFSHNTYYVDFFFLGMTEELYSGNLPSIYFHFTFWGGPWIFQF